MVVLPFKVLSRESNISAPETGETVRIAIDPSGSLGSLYNVYQDNIMGKLPIAINSRSCVQRQSIECRIYKDRTDETQNLLKMVNVDRPTRFSIMLKMIEPINIALIMNYPLKIDSCTRFVYVHHRTINESCYDDLIKRKKSNKLLKLETCATHIITGITWGIQVAIVLQLPLDQQIEIDRLLEQIRCSLTDGNNPIEIGPKEKNLIDQIISMTIYSNISGLTRLTRLDDIYHRISEMLKRTDEHRQLEYILHPIELFVPQQNKINVRNVQWERSKRDNFEDQLIQKTSELRFLQLRLDQELPELLQGKLDEQLAAVRQRFSEVQILYESIIEKLRNALIRLRNNDNALDSIDGIPRTVSDSLQEINTNVNKLILKGKLITQLQNESFQYFNVSQLGINQECSEQLVKDILFKNDMNKIIFCSTDILKEQCEIQWNRRHSQMINEKQKYSQQNLIYADFTYSTWSLEKLMILSLKEQAIIQAPISNDKYINILLLGESGVGKSTFINAFANYLQFHSLQQAQNGKPILIIPVSFLMTINENFDEQLIKFGDTDPNEDHSKSGQSVTQQCRSYVFTISQHKKLRIIDTPGFGDTRGIDQDHMNMNDIFSFINNLTYLNGICLLLKPNSGQLNPFLYSCFIQLFQYFGENIREHLIFCFTNARSTFFTPGDTRPLLTTLFNSLPVKKIPFEKRNIFCFDNESFRYLVARQNGIEFNENDKEEFEESWSRSVEECRRFRDFLCDKLDPYEKGIGWQSIREVEFEINCMIRPMLEGIRNILRNILLHDNNAMIKLKATCVEKPTIICYTCERTPMVFGNCWILLDHLHSSSTKCKSNQQSFVEYTLNYEFNENEINETKDILNEQQTILCKTSARFAHFLIATQSRHDEPFLIGLNRMIQEERTICQRNQGSHMNEQLVEELEKFKTKYEMHFNSTLWENNDKGLCDLYDLIKSIHTIRMVKEQMNAVKEYQEHILATNEQKFCLATNYS